MNEEDNIMNEEDQDFEDDYEYYEEYNGEEDEFLIDGVGFADPGGNSALRAATKSNPRNLPCPNCKRKNRLTLADVRAGYQCNSCADRAERGGDY